MTEETKIADAPAAGAPLDMASGSLPKPSPAAVAALADAYDPLAKAIAGGYVEPEPATREERVNALIGEVEHAMQHNAPMTAAMLTEMKALLLGDE